MQTRNESLVSDYMLDLEADIRFDEKRGESSWYTRQCRECLTALKEAQSAGKSIRVDRYGIPVIEKQKT